MSLAVGIVGAGEITRRAHLPVLLNLPDVRVAWIADKSPARAAALARAYGVAATDAVTAERLPPCDVALLAIPVAARDTYLEHFSTTGTAVFCEKPFALTAAEHRRVVARFDPAALGCGYMRRFFRSTLILRHVVATGLFGPLRGIDVHEGNRSKGSGVDASFLDDPRLGAASGVLMDLGSHSVDLALHISGARRFDVRDCVNTLDGAIDRQVSATVDLEDDRAAGSAVELRYGVSWLERQTNQIRLTFERTTVWANLGVGSAVCVGDPARPLQCLTLDATLPGATTYNQAFFLEWSDFLDGVRHGRESRVSARSAELTTALVERLLAFPAGPHG